VIAIAERRSDKRYIDKLSRGIVAEAFKYLPKGTTITMEHIKKWADLAGNKFAPFMLHKQSANQKRRKGAGRESKDNGN
jgi:hypothetical protein